MPGTSAIPAALLLAVLLLCNDQARARVNPGHEPKVDKPNEISVGEVEAILNANANSNIQQTAEDLGLDVSTDDAGPDNPAGNGNQADNSNQGGNGNQAGNAAAAAVQNAADNSAVAADSAANQPADTASSSQPSTDPTTGRKLLATVTSTSTCKCPNVQPRSGTYASSLKSCPAPGASSQSPPYGQDPSIIFYKGLYIGADVDFQQGVYVRVSSSLSTLYTTGWQLIYTEPQGNFITECPSIHAFSDAGADRFIIYYASVSYNTIKVIESTTNNPLNAWVSRGQLAGVTGYDPYLMVHPAGSYLLYSNYAALNIIKVSPTAPWTTIGSAATIATPTYSWEQLDNTKLNEAPAAFIASSTVNVMYSTNLYCSPNYQTGLLRSSTTANPMLPSSWTKVSTPVFQSALQNSAYGPGSGCFFKNANGQVVWAYGGFNKAAGVPCNAPGRTIRSQVASFTPDGTVCLDIPGSYPAT